MDSQVRDFGRCGEASLPEEHLLTMDSRSGLFRRNYDAAYDYFSPGFQSRVSRRGWVDDKLRDQPTASGMHFSGVSGDASEADVNLEFETSGLETSSSNTGCNDWVGQLPPCHGRRSVADRLITPLPHPLLDVRQPCAEQYRSQLYYPVFGECDRYRGE
jgi:hypothetical protein